MSLDIAHILRDWPYEPGQISTRRVRGDDDRERIQLRLDLGLLQMETTGRPDGDRPNGHDSLFDYYQHELRKHIEEHGDEKGFALDERACELLRSEGLMYYHRYLAEFILEDFEAVERDTMRNLAMMDFCNKYAEEESDRYVLEQYRPYVLMMCARGRGHHALRDNRPKAALAALKKAIKDIKRFYKSFGQEELIAASSEIAVLRAMAKEIESNIPVNPMERLRRDLAKAVKAEHYEEAASLRDKIEQITRAGPDGPTKP